MSEPHHADRIRQEPGKSADSLQPPPFPRPRYNVRKRLRRKRLMALLGRYFSPIWPPAPPELITLRLPFAHWPARLDGLTILQISDTHCGPTYPPSSVRQVVDLALQAQPDVIVLTGDYQSFDSTYMPLCAREFARLHAPGGVYAVMGNHDYPEAPERAWYELVNAGIRVLVNEACPLPGKWGELWMAGVDDARMGAPNLCHTLRPIPAGAPAILLAHEPDFANVAVETGRFNLQLSGHSHGGQLRILGFERMILPELGRRYPMGLRRVGAMWLYTNRGVGFGMPLRINCPPEITRFELVPSAH